ncbi:MAG: transglutaminase family protein [Planctomycetaceae bacterium]|nr:MAG: transglutaminase family protein [Planctomycetaceae bacterium]
MPESSCYRITHRTEYRYSDPVAICQNQVMLTPRELPRVRCHRTDVQILPAPGQCRSHADYFGNPVHTFAIETAHRDLSVTVASDVEVQAPRYPEPDQTAVWEGVRDAVLSGQDPDWYAAEEYRYPSAMVAVGAQFADYAAASFTPGRPILSAGLDLTRRIHADFRYDVTATKVDTLAEASFRLRAGVCQDFAHIQIACLRSLGLPARYVSGYLRTIPPPGKPRLVGADQSHAWASLYGGSQLGWVDLDPTNACVVATDHVPISIGRDYRDVAPMRGVVLGGGSPALTVRVDVVPVASFG